MTEIGKMIRDEGIQEGIKEGVKKGKAKILIKLLIKKFKFVPQGYMDRINNLTEDTIEVIAMDIFDLERIEDLEEYFG